MAKSNYANVRKYRKRYKTSNIGVAVFFIVFLYLSVTVFLYLSKEDASIYQITEEGSLVNKTEHTGIILRDEQVITSDNSGYIRFFAYQGKRVSVGDLIYSLDEKGEVTKQLAENYSYKESLKSMDLTELKQQITSFVYDFNSSEFLDVYEFKMNTQQSIINLMNYNNQDYLQKLLMTLETDGMFNLFYSNISGIISYNIDGYEQLAAEMIKPDNFNKANYSGNVLTSTDFVEYNAPVYKIIKDNSWKLIFSLSDEDYLKYANLTKMTISLSEYEYEFTVPFSIIKNETGNYGCLNFDKYSAEFANVRYLDFEIIYEDNIGLKIPLSAVITKDFYIIPIEYSFLSQGVYGFYLETYDDQNNRVVEFIEPTIYNATETHYYIDTSALPEGSYLIKLDNDSQLPAEEQERFRIGTKDTLSGVYNVNKGYAIFRKIELLDSNKEYCIVKQGITYGISLYDHIILDGKTVKEGQVIYQ